MQGPLRSLFPALFAVTVLFSCQNDPAPPVETPAKPDTIRVKPVPATGSAIFIVTEGTVFWSGKKALGDLQTGTINVKGGEMTVNSGQLVKGAVQLDMNSIAVASVKDGGEKRDFESHLKDDDFFDVKKFPVAEFKFEEVLPSTMPAFNAVISGDLTMKGKTNRVNIPVKLTVTDTELVAESAAFPINRTHWGVNFRSGVLGTAKDKLIEDVVPLSLKLKAKKKAE